MQMRYRGVLAEKWHMMANAKFNWAESDYRNHTTGSVVGDAQYWQREWYASAAVLYEPTQFLSFDYSADYLMNSLNSTIGTYGHPHRHTILQALVAKAQLNRLTAITRLLSTITHHPSAITQIQHLTPNTSPLLWLYPIGFCHPKNCCYALLGSKLIVCQRSTNSISITFVPTT